jgi:hypothetical protein
MPPQASLMARLVLALLFVLAGPAAAQPTGWHTYTDAKSGFSLSYPDGWTLAPNFDDQGYGYVQGNASDHITGAAVFAPATLQADTNLRAGGTYVLVETLPRSPAKCFAADFIVDPPADYRIFDERNDGDRAVLTSGDPGDMSAHEDSVTVLSHAPCLAVHEVIGFAPRDREFGRDEPPFDRDKLVKLLDAIRATVAAVPR